MLSFACNIVSATPQDGLVVAGQAQISQEAHTLTITQTTPNAIINWKSFNIDPGEHARFQQPDNGIILNRINAEQGASQILGRLSANGTVMLVNTAGILFGKTAQVNVGNIIASTADITNQNFMQNKFIFDKAGNPNATLVNQGNITVKEHGLVALIGNGVRNDGLINAKLGKVALAHGENITVDLNGDDLVVFGIQSEHKSPSGIGVDNRGEIHAAGGYVLLTANAAAGVLDQAINMSGLIDSTTIENQAGKIIFYGHENGTVNVTGNIDLTGLNNTELGGNLRITGEKVHIEDQAEINVSGMNGGGEILIGGYYQGISSESDTAKEFYVTKRFKHEEFKEQPNLVPSKYKTSKHTLIGADVIINADALDSGDAGSVVLWSDGIADYSPTISATTVSASGYGGFIEMSGHELQRYSSKIDTRNGGNGAGELLLDPAFLTVVTAGGSSYSAGANNLFANNSSGTNLITPASIVTAAVGANITLQANTDVTFTNALAIATSARTLTVQAGRSVLINAAVSTTNGAISITANDNSAVSADRAAGAGNITMSGSTLSSGTANLSLTIGATSDATYTPGNITALGLTGGAISLSTPNALTGTTIATSVSLAVDVGADSSITSVISGNGTLTKNGNGLLTLSGINTYIGATAVNTGTLRAGSSTAFGSTAGGVTVANGASIELNAVSITTEAFTLSGAGVGGNGALIGTGTCSHTGTIAMAADTTFGGTGSFTQSGIVSGGFNLIKVGTGTLILSAANTYTGTTTINNGTIRAANASALGTTINTVTVANGATLDINAVMTPLKPVSIQGTGVGGIGAIVGTGTGTYPGPITMVADTTFGGTGNTTTISGIITGAFNLTKVGTGSINFTAANSYGGTTAVNNGTLRASNVTALGSNATAITVASGATLDINAVAVGAKPLNLSGTGVSGVGALIGTGTGSYAGTVTMLGNTTIGGTGNATTLSGVVSGAFNLTKIGTGTFTLSNTNTFDGNLTINAGAISVAADANLGTAPGAPIPGRITLGGGTLFATAAFTINANRGISLTTATTSSITSSASPLTYNGIIAGSGNITKTGAGSLALGGLNSYTGTTTISAGTLSLTVADAIDSTSAVSLANVAGAILLLNNNNQTIGTLSGGGTTGGTITLGSGTLLINETADTTYAGAISGTGNLTLTNASTNTLSLTSTTSTYSGVTTINGGALRISADTNLGTAPGVATPGKIVLNEGDLIANATFTLNANRGIALNGAGGTIQVNPGLTLTYNGVMAGLGSFTKTGTGILSINSVQNYSGSTTINSGTLSLNAANILANSSSIIFADADGAVLACNGFDQAISNLSGGGLNGGELSLGSANATITQNADQTFSGSISGNGNVTLNGTGSNKLILTNSNTAFSGNWNLNSGILSLNMDSNLGATTGTPTAGKINFNGGTLQTTATMVINSNRGIEILTSGANILTDSGTTLTYNGVIAGSAGGALNKLITGTLSLGGANTYDGATNVNAGILNLSSVNSLGSTTSTTVTNGAVLQLGFNAATLTNTNPIVLNGTGITGSGALSFSGSIVTINNPLTIATSSTISGTGGGIQTLGGAITGTSPLAISLDNASLVLPSISLTGANLSVTVGGSVSQTAGITMTGGNTAQFEFINANSDLTLNQDNNFGGTAPVFTGTLANIRDVYLRDTNAAAVVPSFTGLSSLRNLTIVFNNSAISLPAITLNNSGALSITSGGAITQTGILTVPNTSSFVTGNNTINLGQNNLFSGAVSLSNSSTNDVSINNATNLILGSSAVGRNLAVTATGNISQTGALIVPEIVSFNAGSNEILLSSNNQFTGPINLSNTGNNNVQLKNSLATILGTVTVGQDLSLTSGGNITQNSTITATNGVSAFAVTALNSDIILNAANNLGSFTPVFFGTRSNIRDVNLNNVNSNSAVPSFTGLTNLRNLTLVFNNSAMSIPTATLYNSGALIATAGGEISQTGVVTVPGTSTFTAGANPITLTQANQFTGAVTLSNSGANNVSISNANPLVLAASTVGQNLTASSVGSLTQTGILTVPDKSSFTANSGEITLTENNLFAGELSLSNSGANDINVTNALATTLGTTSIGRNFTINSTGNITQSSPITATGGICTFLVSLPTKSILLPEDNNFGSNTPVFGTGGNIVNLSLKNISSTPMMPIVSALSNLHFLDLNFPNGTIALANLHINGTAILEANNITGNLDVHGLELDSNFCNLFGFVNGASGQNAIDQIVLLNTITSGTHFFDGIDMYGTPTPPTPVPSNTTPTISQTTRNIINNTLYIADNFWSGNKFGDLMFNYFNMLAMQQSDKSEDSGCVTYSDDITVCF